MDLGAHGKADTDWLRGRCVPFRLEVMSRTLYHHGKLRNAKDTNYKKGTLYQIEPAWRSRVYLSSGGEYAYGDEPSEAGEDLLHWESLVYGSVLARERETCDGSVGGTLESTIEGCKPFYEWMPWIAMNVSYPCYIHNTDGDPDPEQVFFDIEVLRHVDPAA